MSRTALILILLFALAAPAAAAPPTPSQSSDDVIRKRQLDLEAARDRYDELAYEALHAEIDAAKKLLQDPTLDPALRPEVLMRLAVAYEEMARVEAIREIEEYDRKLRECEERRAREREGARGGSEAG